VCNTVLVTKYLLCHGYLDRATSEELLCAVHYLLPNTYWVRVYLGIVTRKVLLCAALYLSPNTYLLTHSPIWLSSSSKFHTDEIMRLLQTSSGNTSIPYHFDRPPRKQAYMDGIMVLVLCQTYPARNPKSVGIWCKGYTVTTAALAQRWQGPSTHCNVHQEKDQMLKHGSQNSRPPVKGGICRHQIKGHLGWRGPQARAGKAASPVAPCDDINMGDRIVAEISANTQVLRSVL
jgi:hypothetical protein